ncbi:MAG: cytochrome-c peroxidase [Candidatus Methanoperedens sp.]|nr:cytochrome-c peroxidase [Candidatus Methanoperedens sp.]
MGSVYEGSVAGRFGNRKPPASAYAGESPVLSQNMTTLSWAGGMFWDGRATGWTLGDPLAEQAKGPFLNPMEQGLPDAACLVYRVVNSDYKHLYKQVWSEVNIKWPKNTCSDVVALPQDDQNKVNEAYNNIARSIAAYERSKEVSSF